MKIFIKAAAAVLAAAAITGATGELTQASASSSSSFAGMSAGAQSFDDAVGNPGDVNAAASRGVTVTNMSGDTMRLKSVTGDHWFEGRPLDGAEIRPGGEHRWEMQLQYLKDNNETVTYDLIRPDGSSDGEVKFHMRLTTLFFGDVDQSTSCLSISSRDGVSCSASTYNVTLTDRPGTVRDLNGSGPNAVAIDVLQNLCNTGKATCEFKATSQEKRLGPAKQMGSRTGNVSSSDTDKTITVTDSWSSSDSLGGSVSLKIPIAPVELTLQATYNHTWTQTYSFGETVKVVMKPNEWGWVEQRAPYVRHIGTFVVKYGNTTWNIRDVAIDSPDATGKAVTLARTEPMTQQEIDDAKNSPKSAGALIVEEPVASIHLVGEK